MATYSTYAEAEAAYLANADYSDGAGSATKAAAFVTACRALLLLLPDESRAGSTSTRMNMAHIRAELQAAQAWLDVNTTNVAAASVRHTCFEDFRT